MEDKFKIGDYVTRFVHPEGKSTYKLIERIEVDDEIIRYTGKIDGGSSVSLVCKKGNDYLSVGGDWYGANAKESIYSFRLLQPTENTFEELKAM